MHYMNRFKNYLLMFTYFSYLLIHFNRITLGYCITLYIWLFVYFNVILVITLYSHFGMSRCGLSTSIKVLIDWLIDCLSCWKQSLHATATVNGNWHICIRQQASALQLHYLQRTKFLSSWMQKRIQCLSNLYNKYEAISSKYGITYIR